MRTPINYYGGKTTMLKHILPMIPDHHNYTEVFFGGGAVFWAKGPSCTETINDKNGAVVNFYKVLKVDYDELKTLIDASLLSRSEHRRALSILRTNKPVCRIELAWAFWYSANFSFSNKIGGGLKYSNAPGQNEARTLHNKKERFTELLCRRIENTTIECGDALRVLLSRDHKDTFHYIDPPYVGSDQGHYKGYGQVEFDDLLNVLVELKGKWLMSCYPNAHVDIMVERHGWNIKSIPKKITVSKKAEPRSEVLVWNYDKADLFSQ